MNMARGEFEGKGATEYDCPSHYSKRTPSAVSLLLLHLSAAARPPHFTGYQGSAAALHQSGLGLGLEKVYRRVRAASAMGAACCGGTAYVERPFSGIQSNGQYVVDGVVIPRREMSKEEAARRGLTDDDWRGSKWGRTSAYIHHHAPNLLACCLTIDCMVPARSLRFL